MNGLAGLSDSDFVSGQVKIAYIHVDMTRERTLYPAHVLVVVDFVWLVWLLASVRTGIATELDATPNGK